MQIAASEVELFPSAALLLQALKRLLQVSKHFADFTEDQFDFHNYCIRKMTLRHYIEMLRSEDRLYSHIYFSRAAWGAIQAYLELHDAPAQAAKVHNLPLMVHLLYGC